MARGDREEVGGFLVFVSASELFSATSFDVPCACMKTKEKARYELTFL
jgi:hypothetical protein